jgi:hypothetical protein
MSYTNGLDKPSEYFEATTYTGNGSTQSITSLDFSPDWVWLKDRTTTNSHFLYDVIRGATNYLNSNTTFEEQTSATSLTSFNSDGFTLGSYGGTNTSSNNYISWSWKANGAGVSNTAGTISSTVSANTTSGFSIVSYTGNGTSGATVGHGLGVAPKMIIVKNRTRTDAWPVDVRFASGILYLNETGTLGSYGDIEPYTSTAPTSTVFSLGSAGNTNFNTSSLIAYCFAEVKGYSKFSSYTGNGSTDGTFVYLGFKPAFIILRSISGNRWRILDNKRPGFNTTINAFFAELSDAEKTDSGDEIDLLSNGFKLRGTSGNQNASGTTYIYMAFAENPFVTSTSIPTTAR